MKRGMARLLCFTAVLMLAAGLCFASENNLDFTLQDNAGNSVNLASFKGNNPVLLFFWTTWCPYCVKQLKNLDSNYADMSREGLRVLPVNVSEPADKVNRFLARNGVSFPVLLDTEGTLAQAYGLLGVPTYALIDISGERVFFDHYFPQNEYEKLLKTTADTVPGEK